MQWGLPPDTPLMIDRSLTKVFQQVFDAVDEWQRDPKRDLRDLPKFANRLPNLEDIVVDGRSVLGVYSASTVETGANVVDEQDLEDLLIAAERTALEHRLDLMNARAQLYDAWRQIKVTANALKGVLQRRPDQPVHHAADHHQPVRLHRARPSSSRWCSTPNCRWCG